MNAMRSNPKVTLWSVMALSSLLALGAAAPSEGQSPTSPQASHEVGREEPRQQLYAYTLRYQPARDAFDVVQRMLSSEGKITLRPGSRTLEIRDTPEMIQQIGSFLRGFDHTPLTLDLELMVVQAINPPVSPQPRDSPEIPRELISEWRKFRPFQSYQLLARADLEPRENEQVTYEMADGYRVSFRLGTLLANRRIKLHGLRLSRVPEGGQPERVLIHATLTPWMGRAMALAISQSEDDRSALMLVVICRSPRLWSSEVVTRQGAEDGGQR
jgi:hypothetical protein